MQIKYAPTIFSAVFLLLQASIHTVDAIPTEPGSLRNTNGVYKRQGEIAVDETPDQVIDQAFTKYDDCLRRANQGPLEEVRISCFADTFDTNFGETLSKAVTGDNSADGKEFKKLFGDMISNTRVCMENIGPKVNEKSCEEEFKTVLTEVSEANKK